MQALCVPARIEPQNCPPTAFDDRLHFDSTLKPLFSPRCTLPSCPSFVCLSALFLVNTVSLWTISVHFPRVVLTSDAVTSAACTLVLLSLQLSCIAVLFLLVEFLSGTGWFSCILMRSRECLTGQRAPELIPASLVHFFCGTWHWTRPSTRSFIYRHGAFLPSVLGFLFKGGWVGGAAESTLTLSKS